MELWKAVPGWDHYEASDLGRVKSLPHQTPAGMRGGCILRGSPHAAGYRVIHLVRDGVDTQMLRHRVILLTFIGECPEGKEVRHLDGNPANDALTNLQYGTHRENQIDIGKYHLPLEQRLSVEELECSLPNCREKQIAREMCSKHYHRWHRTGSPYHIRKLPNGGLPENDADTLIVKNQDAGVIEG